jgi:tol-pal system protein YbgF
MKNPIAWIVLGIVLITAGCSLPPPTAKDDVVAQNLAQLKTGQRDLAGEVSRLRDNLLLLEARLQDQQKGIDELRQALVAQKVTSSREKAGEMPLSPAVAPGDKEKKEPSPTEIYLKAFANYTSARFQEAISGFENFLTLYPDNDFAGNAQYWLGECFYSLQQYPRAVEEFGKAVKNYPQGGKTPDAMLKLAAALQQMNQGDRAAETLRLLQQRYPDSQAARKVREKTNPGEKN